jgi:hypothetical protein
MTIEFAISIITLAFPHNMQAKIVSLAVDCKPKNEHQIWQVFVLE